jgi:hypothetical protein
LFRFTACTGQQRVAIVFTDGESAEPEPRLAALGRAGIRSVFVRVWGAQESIWRPEGAEPQYRPDPSGREILAAAAAVAGGAVYGERDLDAVVSRVRQDLGEGRHRLREQRDLIALMPFVTLAMLVPLALLLRQRNL